MISYQIVTSFATEVVLVDMDNDGTLSPIAALHDEYSTPAPIGQGFMKLGLDIPELSINH